MKQVDRVRKAPSKHWVGDGFEVQSMFSYRENNDNLSPFLLMDYNPPRYFEPNREFKQPRGVGEHPHRGFETVTLAYQGEVSHSDSYGGGGTIGTGDVQWMTAGSGLMHQEYHSEKFSKEGGMFEMVQLWVNLPAKDKMTQPKYQAISSQDIPVVNFEENAGSARIVAGNMKGTTGIASTFTPINMWDVRLNANKSHLFEIPENHNLIILVLDGEIKINNGDVAKTGELVTFVKGGKDVELFALQNSKILILTGEPINEPVFGYGPFVMNNESEIIQAILDVQEGKFGEISN